MDDRSRQRTTSFADAQAQAAAGSQSGSSAVSGITVTERDGQKITTVLATPGTDDATREVSYKDTKVVGNGSFGVVFQVNLLGTGETAAIKKVLQDKRFKNRELQIMRTLKHENVVDLKYFFYSTGTKKDEIYLNLILEFLPETVYQVAKSYVKEKKISFPFLHVKLYTYQLCRALAYIHSIGICHRDIKPQNLLLDPSKGVLKLCDFGSAKKLIRGEPNVSYICSRYYRAPELIFGATDYTSAIDVWSGGCVMVELLYGQPIFPGDSGVDQLVEIIKKLGTPTRAQIKAMNPNYTDFKFPQIKAQTWAKIFEKRRPQVPDDASALCARLLEYEPEKRIGALEALMDPFFDELRDPMLTFEGRPLPPLFNFSEDELSAGPPEWREKLIPPHAR